MRDRGMLGFFCGDRSRALGTQAILLKPRCPHLPQEVVLMVPDGNVLIFGRVGDDLDEPPHLSFGIQGHAEEL